MNTRLRKVIYSVTAAMLLGFSQGIAVESFGYDGSAMKQRRTENFDAVVKELQLTPAQEQQIAEQKNREKEQVLGLREKMRAVRIELSRELDKESVDNAKVASLVAEMKELIGQRIENKINGIIAMKSILTPEQFRVLNEKNRKSGYHRKSGLQEKDKEGGAP